MQLHRAALHCKLQIASACSARVRDRALLLPDTYVTPPTVAHFNHQHAVLVMSLITRALREHVDRLASVRSEKKKRPEIGSDVKVKSASKVFFHSLFLLLFPILTFFCAQHFHLPLVSVEPEKPLGILAASHVPTLSVNRWRATPFLHCIELR